MIQIKENGEFRRVTRLEAIVKQMTNKALAGDLKAAKEICTLVRFYEETELPDIAASPDGEKDEAVKQRLLERILKTNNQLPEVK